MKRKAKVPAGVFTPYQPKRFTITMSLRNGISIAFDPPQPPEEHDQSTLEIIATAGMAAMAQAINDVQREHGEYLLGMIKGANKAWAKLSPEERQKWADPLPEK